jgi:hypothetical protein
LGGVSDSLANEGLRDQHQGPGNLGENGEESQIGKKRKADTEIDGKQKKTRQSRESSK